jgi:DNA invertase Pin-like site-specific DNA recombinase
MRGYVQVLRHFVLVCSVAGRGQVTSINLESDSQGDLALRPEHPEQIIAMAFSMAAEIEHDLMSQRTKEALRFKTAQGMKLGRPMGSGKSKLDPYRPEIESLLANGSTQKFIARRYHTTEANSTIGSRNTD